MTEKKKIVKKKTSLYLEPEDLKELQIQAIKEDCKQNDIVEKLVKEYLKKCKNNKDNKDN